MDGIPPTLPSDTEDVVWALQTAESLWKRGERVDAIVWLRRAAQAAGEAQDDIRAAMLARNAAELSDWIASHTMHGDSIEPPESKNDSDVDDLLSIPAPASEEVVLSSSHVEMISSQDFEAGFRAPSKRPVSLRPSNRRESTPSESGVMQLDVDEVELLDGPHASPMLDAHESDAPSDIPPPSKAGASGVPSAAEAHAGMLDPWAEHDLKKGASAPKSRPSRPTFDDEEVTTSTLPRKAQAPPSFSGLKVPTPPKAARVPPANVGRKPPPPRPRPQTDEAPTASYQKLNDRGPVSEAETPISSTSMEILEELDARVTAKPDAHTSASPPSSRRMPPRIPEPASSRPFPLSKPSTRPSAAATPMPPPTSGAPTKPPPSGEGEQEEAPVSAIPPTRASNRPEVTSLGLESVEALGDLPDDAREAFEKAATIHALSKDEEVARFALALVVEGEIDVSSELVDEPAMKLGKGAILRSRGTLAQGVNMRLVCSSEKARVASWDDAAVAAAFRTCPWVEEDLRVVADRVQTRVGITMGPLGERLDMALREHLASKLAVKSLAPGEEVVTEGKSVPILIVAVGELELETKGKKSGVIRAGDFYFPTNVLAGGAAPATARAGKGGALVLYGEHRLATELMMTFPPLLEIFPGM